ncbi:MAG: hypothetical protein JKY65_23125 [Planctomycetes bacterium]|nr:hypothetical protein [Planctomycetota bacterium]
MVASFDLDEVIEVDLASRTITNRWPVGNGPTDLVNGITQTFVANTLSQDITVIDRLAGNVSQTIDVTAVPITGVSFLGFLDNILKPMVRPTGIGITPNGSKIYSANLINVTVIDGQTLTPTKSILGLSPISLTSLISNPSQALSGFLAAPVQGLGMAKIACTNQYALATCLITGKVMRIDVMTDRVVDYIDVGRAPMGIAVARNKAYVACALSQEVYIIDLATGMVIGQLQAGMVPTDVAAGPNEDVIYVANTISGDITVIDTTTDSVIDTLPAGMAISQIFAQMGITLPTGSGGGIGGALNGFLQGFTGGMTNPSSFGALISGGGGGLLSPGNLINGLLTGFLAYAGVNQQALAGLNLPGIGILSVAVAHDDDYVATGNALMGELVITDVPTKQVDSITGLTGLGPVDIATVWRK